MGRHAIAVYVVRVLVLERYTRGIASTIVPYYGALLEYSYAVTRCGLFRPVESLKQVLPAIFDTRAILGPSPWS